MHYVAHCTMVRYSATLKNSIQALLDKREQSKTPKPAFFNFWLKIWKHGTNIALKYDEEMIKRVTEFIDI